MERNLATGVVIVVWCCTNTAWALDTLKIQVTHQQGRYTATAAFLIDAPRKRVYSVLTDYAHLERISPHIVASGLLGRGPRGRPLVHVVTESCVLFFCRTVETVEAVTESSPARIHTRVLPERSDLAYGVTTWRLIPRDGQTRLIWRTTFDPDFWVPPLIGPAAIEMILKTQLVEGAAGIEHLAQSRRPRGALTPATGGKDNAGRQRRSLQ